MWIATGKQSSNFACLGQQVYFFMILLADNLSGPFTIMSQMSLKSCYLSQVTGALHPLMLLVNAVFFVIIILLYNIFSWGWEEWLMVSALDSG